MTRPQLRETEKKTARFTIRFRNEERDELEAQAEIHGLSISELIRRRALQKRIVPVTDLKTISELRRIGGLIKFFYNETGGLYRHRTAALLDELHAAVVRVGKERS